MDEIEKIAEVFNKSLREIGAMPIGLKKCASLALYGLLEDGSHHKQWFLAQIVTAAGYNIEELRRFAVAHNYDWDNGIAP